MAQDAELPVGQLPYFKTPVIRDQKLARQAAAFHKALANYAPQLELDSKLYAFLGSLLSAYSDVVVPNDHLQEHRAVRITLEYLNEHFAQNITLEAIAAHTQLSPFHLQRVFKHSTGLSPHEYQAQVRVYRARDALRQGESISGSATRVGLFDQSHLNRHFKRILGFTPGKYREGLVRDSRRSN
jgi:AraC-like DNA-binding protein